MRVLVTRPKPQASGTARRLEALGHVPLVAPMLETVALPPPPLPAAGALAVTSRTAFDVLAGHPDLPAILGRRLYAVGDATAAAARARGFTHVASAAGDVGDLARLIAADAPAGGVTHLAGEERAGDLAGDLARHGIAATTVALYRMAATERLPGPALDALRAGAIDAILVYSPRSAAALLAAAERDGVAAAVLATPLLTLSEAVAAPLRTAGAARLSVARRPDETALLGLLATGGTAGR